MSEFTGSVVGDVELGQGTRRKIYSEVTFTVTSTGQHVAVAYTRDGGRTWLTACGTCAGTGHRDAYEHVEGGRCWHCRGAGVRALGTTSLASWLRAAA